MINGKHNGTDHYHCVTFTCTFIRMRRLIGKCVCVCVHITKIKIKTNKLNWLFVFLSRTNIARFIDEKKNRFSVSGAKLIKMIMMIRKIGRIVQNLELNTENKKTEKNNKLHRKNETNDGKKRQNNNAPKWAQYSFCGLGSLGRYSHVVLIIAFRKNHFTLLFLLFHMHIYGTEQLV